MAWHSSPQGPLKFSVFLPPAETLMVGRSFYINHFCHCYQKHKILSAGPGEIKNVRLFEGSRLTLTRYESEKIPLSQVIPWALIEWKNTPVRQ